jgi:hypothetical protein
MDYERLFARMMVLCAPITVLFFFLFIILYESNMPGFSCVETGYVYPVKISQENYIYLNYTNLIIFRIILFLIFLPLISIVLIVLFTPFGWKVSSRISKLFSNQTELIKYIFERNK